MRVLIATLQRSPYVAPVLLGLAFGAVVLVFDVKAKSLSRLTGFAQQVLTGSLMVALLAYQWVLFFKRVTRDARNARQTLNRHRWVGVAVTFLFAVHAVRFGHVWMTTLSLCMFGVALTAVMNREVLRYRSNAIYLAWLVCHIGLSAALAPLVAVHIWVALAYQ